MRKLTTILTFYVATTSYRKAKTKSAKKNGKLDDDDEGKEDEDEERTFRELLTCVRR